MKILSSYKDYYDYLTGIYGEDPILILDRRNHNQPGILTFGASNIAKYRLWIGNHLVEFLSYKGTPYYGEDIKSISGIKIEDGLKYRFWYSNYEKQYGKPMSELIKLGIMDVTWGRAGFESCTILTKPIKIDRPIFLDAEVVIGLGSYDKENGMYNYNYPILQNLGLNKFVPPEEVYKWITEYLSEQKLKNEQHLDLRTDIQRLEGKGFDKKTSFRPNIKK